MTEHHRKGELNRRQFLASTVLATLGMTMRGSIGFAETSPSLDLEGLFGPDYPTGVSVCVVRDWKRTILGAHGWADRDRRIQMSADTLLNVASVTKTVTSLAIMQLVEEGKLRLDNSIDNYLPYALHNPRFKDVPLTIRQLLTHRSSLADSPVYDVGYACGDPEVSLGEWLEAYLVPGRENYDAENNFHVWMPGTIDPPGEPRPYSNVGYGLLGYIAECVTGENFASYVHKQVLNPLEMSNSNWFLADIEIDMHASLYEQFPDQASGESLRPDMSTALWDDSNKVYTPGELRPLCMYGHPTYPDGFLRSSATDLGKFLMAMLGEGVYETRTIISTESLELMFSTENYGRALCWSSTTLGGKSETIWYHNGSDPGVMTMIGFRPADGTGIVILCNCGDPGPGMGALIRQTFLG